MQILLTNYGIISRIVKCESELGQWFQLNITREWAEIFLNEIGFISARKNKMIQDSKYGIEGFKQEKSLNIIPYIQELRAKLRAKYSYGNGIYKCVDGQNKRLNILPEVGGSSSFLKGGRANKEYVQAEFERGHIREICPKTDEKLQAILNSGLVFDRVTSIKQLGALVKR
jgi:hypothetical protein